MTNIIFGIAGAFITALLVQGCSDAVDEKAAATEAQRILETNIGASFDKKDVSISRVNIIQDGSEDFVGSAEIKIMNDKIDVPFTMKAKFAPDGKITSVVKTDYRVIADQLKSSKKKIEDAEKKRVDRILRKIVAKHPYEVLVKPYTRFSPQQHVGI